MYNFDYNYSNLLSLTEEENCPEYPLPIKIKSTNGCYLIDEQGKYYLDLTSNKECQPLGYFNNVISNSSFYFNSGLFESFEEAELEKNLCKVTGLSKVLFTASQSNCYKIGCDIVENFLKDSEKNKVLISSTEKSRDKYRLKIENIEYIPLNSESIAKSLFAKTVGAIIVEIAQINDDFQKANNEYLCLLRELCDRNNALLVIDAANISPLRLNNDLFNFNSNIKPDILMVSKGLSNGIPFGAVILSDKIKYYVESENEGTISLAYNFAFNFINSCYQSDLRDTVQKNADYIEKSLNFLVEKHISLGNIRRYGMLFTIATDISAYELVNECLKEGLIIEALNVSTIKLSPPYTIGKEEIDKLINILDKLFNKLAIYDRLI